jgi:phage host-nuclease inhibitor protein Gam
MVSTKQQQPTFTVLDAAISDMITKIAHARADLAAAEAGRSAAVAVAAAKYASGIADCEQRIGELSAQVEVWATEHRRRLLAGAKGKTVDVGPHRVAWKSKPARLALSATLDEVLQSIRAKHWASSFIRVKEELDKTALLADPDRAKRVDGVAIVDGEETFTISPNANAAKGGAS